MYSQPSHVTASSKVHWTICHTIPPHNPDQLYWAVEGNLGDDGFVGWFSTEIEAQTVADNLNS